MNVNEMSVIELKAVLFDIDQEIKQYQSKYQQIVMILKEKVKKEEALMREKKTAVKKK